MRLFLVSTLLFLVSNIFAQESIELTLRTINSKGNSIDNVEIHLLNNETFGSKQTNGIVKFNKLSRGNYTFEIKAQGYSTLVQQIDAKESKEITIVLETEYIKLSDIVVTGSKKESMYYKTSGAITSFNSKDIKDLRFWEISDLSGLVPNLNLAQSGDNRNVAFIRGIGTTSYEQAVATYIDGVPQFSLDTYIPQFNDIDHIEILNGPQGTLYGRNSMGGLINIITKKPTNTTKFNTDISLAEYGQKRINASLNFPIVKDKLFAHVSFLNDLKNGYYKNDFYQNAFDKQAQTAINANIKYLINNRWSLLLDHKRYQAKNYGAYPLVSGIEELLSNPFHLSQNSVSPMIDKTSNSSLILTYKGEKMNLSIQNSLQQNQRYYENTIDADFSTYDIVGVYNNYGKDFNTVKAFTQEIKFSSPENTASKFKWVAGTFYYNQNNPTKQGTYFGKDAGFIGVPDQEFTIISNNLGKNHGLAFYGNSTLALTDKLSLNGGLRYDKEYRKMTVSGEYEKAPDPAFIINPETKGSTSFAALSPKIGIQYNRTESSIYYLSYNRGFRAGGLTSISSDPSQVPLIAFKPEYSNTFEAGIKGEEFNKRLRFGVDVFYSIVKDIQVPSLILPDAITVVKNLGEMKSKGVEFELTAIPVNGLTIHYGGGYTDAKFVSFKTGQNGAEVDLAGKKQIFTPVSTNLITMQYQHKLNQSGNSSFVIRAEYKVIGKQYFDVSNTIEQAKYNLVNLRTGVQTKSFDFFIWIRNAGNTKYIDYAYDFGAAHLGNPRVIGSTISIKL